ncbi:MAG: translation elongation factor Ts [Spirulina sp. SIO3F2]|nr:translation elongation factor Ts [Spirulina sp. SIO3F2]
MAKKKASKGGKAAKTAPKAKPEENTAKATASAATEAAPKTTPKSESPKAAGKISAASVKALREKTGAGMMDCKKALAESDGDMEKAVEWLRQKGIASASKKSGRIAAEGLVGSYIHTGGRVGVLVEVNCETDFVARGDAFQELVRNVAMQIAACPNVEYVKVDDIPTEFVEKEKSIEMGRDDLGNKPENIREKIVEGRIQKRLKEVSLLDQPYIKDQSITVDELVKQVSGQIGENIRVRRFSRFVLGEGIEKKEEDFAAEVAAATGK